MRYIKTVKAVRMEDDILDKLSKAVEMLDIIIDDLSEIVHEDDYYTQLFESAKGAWANLSDFLEEYEDKCK